MNELANEHARALVEARLGFGENGAVLRLATLDLRVGASWREERVAVVEVVVAREEGAGSEAATELLMAGDIAADLLKCSDLSIGLLAGRRPVRWEERTAPDVLDVVETFPALVLFPAHPCWPLLPGHAVGRVVLHEDLVNTGHGRSFVLSRV